MDQLISIITPVYNAEKTIKDTIKSVLKQTYTNWELILVNDGSTDNSLLLLQNLKEERIKIITKENGGVASARNIGLSEAKGSLAAFLDADDLWHPEKLKRSVAKLEETGSNLFFSDIQTFTNSLTDAKDYKYEEPFQEKNDYLRLLIYDYIPILTVVVQIDVLKDVGYFDQDLQGTEDWDLWIRIAEKYKLCYLPEKLSYYRHSENGLSKNRDRHLKEELKVILKHKMPDNIQRKSLWVWYRKSLSNNIIQKRPFGALRDYLKMIYLIPMKRENYPFFR